MRDEIDVRRVEPAIIASVKRRVRWQEIGQVIRGMYDEVYSFLEASAIGGRGRNVAIYHAPDAEGSELEVGVELREPFTAAGPIQCSSTPAGTAVHTEFRGEYHLLPQAHEMLGRWLAERGERDTMLGWEVYGDWHDDPSQRRTDVFRLLVR